MTLQSPPQTIIQYGSLLHHPTLHIHSPTEEEEEEEEEEGEEEEEEDDAAHHVPRDTHPHFR
jgi:hypothetical protein